MPVVGERYELGELIGEGGFGRTHAATRRETGEAVVVKELLLREVPDWKPVEHFEREARTLAALDHPGVPRFVEAFEDESEIDSGNVRFYIVSEHIVGETLGARITAGHRWPTSNALELARALLEILRYLHELLPPVIHRDIKPDNIVLRESGEPVLVDFGAVRDLVLPGTSGGATVLGTPGYMAPEQALGRSNTRSDLYSLGATLAHAFTHRHPQELLDENMELDADALAQLPAQVRELLTALTRVAPTARPESAAAALELLDGRSAPAPTALARRPNSTNSTLAVPAPGEIKPAPINGRTLTPTIQKELAARPPRPEKMTKIILGPLLGMVALMLLMPFFGEAALLVLPAIVAVAIGLPISLLVRNRRRQRELYETGSEIAGRVTAANRTQTGSFIDYEYELEGQRHQGYAFTRDSLALAQLERGSPVRVIFDPQQPERNLGFVSDIDDDHE